MRIFLLSLVFFMVSQPVFAAENGAGGGVHETCRAWWQQVCKQKMPCQPQTCEEKVQGVQKGMCEPYTMYCKAVSSSGLDGKQTPIDQGLQALSKLLEGLMGQLGKGGGGGGGEPTGAQGSGTNSLLGGTTTLGTTGTLTDAASGILGGSFASSSTATNILTSVFGSGTTTGGIGSVITQTATTTVTSTSATSTTSTSGGGTVISQGSTTTQPTTKPATTTVLTTTGVSSTSAGIEVGVADVTTNSSVSGFYGNASSPNSSSQATVMGRLCVSRPWASGLIASLIKPSLFDSLCVKWGYKAVEQKTVPPPPATTKNTVRTPAKPAPTAVAATASSTVGIQCSAKTVRPGTEVGLTFSCGSDKVQSTIGFAVANNAVRKTTVKASQTTAYGVRCSNGSVHTCEVTVVQPKVTIWSEPKAVSLGTRAQVYWNSKDVLAETCRVTGPSFSERGGYGGAATVPINTPSTYTLTCIGADGATTTAKTVVDLAL